MLRVKFQCPPSPKKRVVVLPLMPIRYGDLQQNAGRSRIARERLLLATKPIVEPPKRSAVISFFNGPHRIIPANSSLTARRNTKGAKNAGIYSFPGW